MHPCYILIHSDEYWAFNQRPHGLLEIVIGPHDISFPYVLPQMIKFPVLQAFLAPLIPRDLACLTMHIWHNGDALEYPLVNCFDGFFIQVTVDVNGILAENIGLAAPLIVPQLHIDQLILPDPQLVQITTYVPGGDTLVSSRALTLVQRRDRAHEVLDTHLRQRFPDMSQVGFTIQRVHPSSKWCTPILCPLREKSNCDVLR